MENSTGFYDRLAPMFDVMTDWETRLAAEGPFLRAALDAVGAARVLDAACGSGGHALWLTRQGYTMLGADASPVMVNLARGKAEEAGLDVPFAVADLMHLAPLAEHAPFDAVICLGNSLPHLLTQEALVAALQEVAGVMRPGGLLILQNLNYDLRWQKQPRWFMAQGGELDGQEVLVWRFADYLPDDGRIAFHIALFRKSDAGWNVDVHTTPQRPLLHDDLVAALGAAGFQKIEAFGVMALPLERFDVARSGDLVVTARRA